MAMDNNSNHKIPAVVMDLFYGSLQVARALGKRGIPVYGIDRSPETIGECSRYIKRIPAPIEQNDLLQYMVDFAKKQPSPLVLFPLSDYYVRFLLKNKDILSPHYLFPLSENGINERLISKVKTAHLFAEHRVPSPRTETLGKECMSDMLLKMDIPFPCIVKPDFHDSWEESTPFKERFGHKRVLFINDRTELTDIVDVIAGLDEIVIQEFIPGPSTNFYYYAGYRSRKGGILCSFVGNKIRTYPDGTGTETLLKSVHCPQVREMGDELLHKLGYVGAAGIDFKYDNRDGLFKIIEVNSRIGVNDCYLADYGLDIAYIYYCEAQGCHIDPVIEYPSRITWYSFRYDLDWMRDYSRKYNVSWFQWLKDLICGYDNYLVFSWDDPKPFMSWLGKRLPNFIKIMKKSCTSPDPLESKQ